MLSMFRCFKDVKMETMISTAVGLITLKDLVTSVENSGLVCNVSIFVGCFVKTNNIHCNKCIRPLTATLGHSRRFQLDNFSNMPKSENEKQAIIKPQSACYDEVKTVSQDT